MTATAIPPISTMPLAGTVPTENIRGELLRRVNALSVKDCTKVLRYMNTMESEWDDEEWDEFCDEFEHSPENAIAKAEKRAGWS
jgi:hypothetical protein